MKNSGVIQNAAWIVGAKIIQSAVGLIISMLTARYLGPANYGLINYAASIVAFFTPIMKLGLNGIIVHEIVTKPEDEGKTMGTAVVLNCISGVLCMVGIVAFTSIMNAGENETILVCILYSISMLMEAVQILQYWFQAKLLSKYISIAMLVAYLVAAVYRIILLVIGASVAWFAVSTALDIAIIDIILLKSYQSCGGKRLSFSLEHGKAMLARSKYYIISGLMVVIFAQTDRIMLKMMIGNEAAGYYSAAVACAGITGFVFSAIIDSARPVILEGKKNSQSLFEKRVIQLYSIIIYLSLIQCVVITAASPLIIGVLYGSAYRPAVSSLRIIVWYTTFAYLGSVRNIWILAEGKQKYVWRINLLGAVANVLLNALLIPVWGIDGAAFASLVTQIFTNVFVGNIFKEIRMNNSLMFRSLDIKVCFGMMRGILKKKERCVREEN